MSKYQELIEEFEKSFNNYQFEKNEVINDAKKIFKTLDLFLDGKNHIKIAETNITGEKKEIDQISDVIKCDENHFWHFGFIIDFFSEKISISISVQINISLKKTEEKTTIKIGSSTYEYSYTSSSKDKTINEICENIIDKIKKSLYNFNNWTDTNKLFYEVN